MTRQTHSRGAPHSHAIIGCTSSQRVLSTLLAQATIAAAGSAPESFTVRPDGNGTNEVTLANKIAGLRPMIAYLGRDAIINSMRSLRN
jgi:hypothetical protein